MGPQAAPVIRPWRASAMAGAACSDGGGGGDVACAWAWANPPASPDAPDAPIATTWSRSRPGLHGSGLDGPAGCTTEGVRHALPMKPAC